MENEFCRNCKHLRKLKHNFIVGKGFEESYCCLMWEYDKESNENGYNEAWIQEVDLDDVCECFIRGKNCVNCDDFS